MTTRSPFVASFRVAAALGVLTAVGGTLPVRAQVRPEVGEVRFVGNDAFPTDSLERAIVTRSTECRSLIFEPLCWVGAEFAIHRAYLPRRDFPLDQLRLQIWYQRRGYREASIDTATVVGSDGRVRVTFTVDEGRPVLVGDIEYVGVEELDAPDLLVGLPIKVGDALSNIAVDAARDSLTRRLANLGYARVEVLRSFFISRSDPYTARVTFDIASGPRSRYGHVEVTGNSDLTESTVLRTLQFRAGDVYRLDQLRDAQARLFGLEIIRGASVVPDFAGADSVIPVRVSIQEGEPHRVRTGAGLSTSECVDVDSRWVSRNFLGGGRRLQVRGRVSNIMAKNFGSLLCWQAGEGEFAKLNWTAAVDFAQPWVFSTRNAFQASVFAERQSMPEVFIRKAVGLSVALTRAIGPRTPLTLSYRPELSELAAAELLFCTGFLVCDPEDIGTLQDANWIAPVALTFTRNVSNSLLNPSRGYSALVELEQAGAWSGSDFAYARIQAEISRYVALSERGVMAGRVRGGWVHAGEFGGLLSPGTETSVTHPQKRFYAGGANSVRGFAQGRLGPRVLYAPVSSLLNEDVCTPEAVASLACDATPLGDDGFQEKPTGGTRVLEGSLETRIAVASTVQGAVFADFGQVWDTGEHASLGSLQVTPGFGVRYLSPIGPLRVDLAYRFSGGEHMSVVTNQLRPFQEGVDDPDDRVTVGDERVPFVKTGALAILGPQVFYNDSSPGSLRRWQLHISIGQAF